MIRRQLLQLHKSILFVQMNRRELFRCPVPITFRNLFTSYSIKFYVFSFIMETSLRQCQRIVPSKPIKEQMRSPDSLRPKINFSTPFPIKILFPYAAIFYAFLCCWRREAIFSDWFERYPARNWSINLSMSLEFSNRKNIARAVTAKSGGQCGCEILLSIGRRRALQWVRRHVDRIFCTQI